MGRDRRTPRGAVTAVVVATLSVLLVVVTNAGNTSAHTGAVAGTSTHRPLHPPRPSGHATSFRFLSSPDFFNADIGDLSTLPGWPDFVARWHQRFPGVPVPDSWNDHQAALVGQILGQFAAEKPDDVLVAGDTVAGHWGMDKWYVHGRPVRTGIFGPTSGPAERMAALDRAADFYFGAYADFFADRGLPLWPAIGDHEYGDNPWSGPTPYHRLKRAAFPTIRKRFDEHLIEPRIAEGADVSRPAGPAARTAYATYLDPEVLLVSLDDFHPTGHAVTPQIDRQQLAWVRSVLAAADRAGTDWIIVQGHLPIVPTVRVSHSSAICYRGGTRSPLWRTMVEHHVDLYLNGEVHDNSVNTVDGITQISHGGLFAKAYTKGSTAYLVGDITGGRLSLTLKRWDITAAQSTPRVWQTTPKTPVLWAKTLSPEPRTIGTMTVTKNRRILSQHGLLDEYRGGQRCGFKDGRPHVNL
jgi:hypothetical protein